MRYIVSVGYSKSDPVVVAYDREANEMISTWASSLPADDTEWPP